MLILRITVKGSAFTHLLQNHSLLLINVNFHLLLNKIKNYYIEIQLLNI